MGQPEGGDLYQQAVQVVLRDRKASTSYIQRRLQIGYNRAASLMERMEKKGWSVRPTTPASAKF
jgi:S-DNA-T family DNA segregation ATPase FtsK/SpoIIIE